MFNLENIVRPKKEYIGSDFKFKIKEIKLQPFDENLYKLERIKPLLDMSDLERITPLLDMSDSDIPYQLREIKSVENSIWKENELELVGPTPDYPQEIRNKNLYNMCVQGNPEGITIQGDSSQPITVQLSDEIMKWSKVSTDSSLNVLQGGKKICTITKKEENEMDILDLYKERKNQLLMNNFYKERQEIIEEDEIQKIKEEMIKQINIILDNEERNEKFETLVPGIAKNVFTKQTQEKINKLEVDLDLEKDKLYNTIQEVKALFEMTDSYEERIKILKNYDILDKNGKLRV